MVTSPEKRRNSGKKRRTAGCLVFLWLFLYAFPVSAAVGDTVQTIANPAGSTIDVFDYWVYQNGSSTVNGYYNTGINAGSHPLVFRYNGGVPYGDWNNWTGSGKGAWQGIVASTLGEDGYPVLDATGYNNIHYTDSLAYLFDYRDIDVTVSGTSKPAKRTYEGANYLFTVDEDGYYVFDSTVHKAKLDTDSMEFTVTEQKNGEFYPLSDSLTDKYFFGVHMSTPFSMPADGKVLNPSGVYQDMVYEFSGDDDVWLYIDGVLVGDAGGIHDAQDLIVNFATGKVTVRNTANQGSVHTTTIYDMFVVALGEEKARADYAWKLEEDGTYKTFAGGTYHTMDFFYLERGAGKSNMKIKYNLVSTYDFTGHKVLYSMDPYNTPVLQRSQFKYRLTGYPLQMEDGTYLEAVMPKVQPDSNVYWEPDYEIYALTAENQSNSSEPKTLVVGNSADGNVNFGGADLNGGADEQDTELGQYVGRTFRYVYEELPPDGAVANADGTYTYKGQTVSPNADGTYTFDGIVYDSTKFYFEGTVSLQGWINKTYYTDDTYTVKKDVNYVNFVNMLEPSYLTVTKQVSGNIGSRDREFAFTLTVPSKAGETLYYSKNGGEKVAEQLGEDGILAFTLAHGDSIVFYGLQGKQYTVTESEYGDYDAAYAVNGGSFTEGSTCSRTFSAADGSEQVDFENELNTTPPTGIGLPVLPALFGLALGGALLAAAFAGRGVRRHE